MQSILLLYKEEEKSRVERKPLVSEGEYSFVSYIWHYGKAPWKGTSKCVKYLWKEINPLWKCFWKWVDLVPNLKFEKKTTKSNLVSNVRCKWYHIDILRCFKYGIFILFCLAGRKTVSVQWRLHRSSDRSGCRGRNADSVLSSLEMFLFRFGEITPSKGRQVNPNVQSPSVRVW